VRFFVLIHQFEKGSDGQAGAAKLSKQNRATLNAVGRDRENLEAEVALERGEEFAPS